MHLGFKLWVTWFLGCSPPSDCKHSHMLRGILPVTWLKPENTAESCWAGPSPPEFWASLTFFIKDKCWLEQEPPSFCGVTRGGVCDGYIRKEAGPVCLPALLKAVTRQSLGTGPQLGTRGRKPALRPAPVFPRGSELTRGRHSGLRTHSTLWPVSLACSSRSSLCWHLPESAPWQSEVDPVLFGDPPPHSFQKSGQGIPSPNWSDWLQFCTPFRKCLRRAANPLS